MPEGRWVDDPLERHELRYWNGTKWTGHVSNSGNVEFDDTGLARHGRRGAQQTSVLTALRKTTYLGSHPAASGQAEGIDIEFTETGISFKAKRTTLATLEWSGVTRLEADDRETITARLTGTRLLLLGAFALVAKKQTTLSFLVVADERGDWIFSIPGLSAIELRSGLTHLQRFVPTTPADTLETDAERETITARLASLKLLYEDGVIDEKEHLSGRRSILGEV